MPLAGLAFIAMLQLTLVCEGRPLRQHLHHIAAGLGALGASWLVAVALYVALGAVVLCAAVIHVLLRVCAAGLHGEKVAAEDWISHVTLNAVALGIFLHVAIGRRWPFAGAPSGPDSVSASSAT